MSDFTDCACKTYQQVSNASTRIIGAQRDMRCDRPRETFCHRNGQDIVQQGWTTGRYFPDGPPLPHKRTTVRQHFRAGKILVRSRENCGATENLSGSQPVEKYLSTVTRDHEVPTLATGEQKESFRRVFLIDDHRGGAKLPMFGDRKHRVELGLRQSRQKAGPKPIGKADILVPGREFAHAIHKILFSAHSATLTGERRYPIFHSQLGQTTAANQLSFRIRCEIERVADFRIPEFEDAQPTLNRQLPEIGAMKFDAGYHSIRPPIWITRAPPVFPCVKPLEMRPAVLALLRLSPGLLGLKMLKTLITSPRICNFVLS